MLLLFIYKCYSSIYYTTMSSFQTKSAKSSRVTKRKTPAKTAFTSYPRRKALQSKASKLLEFQSDSEGDDELDDHGPTRDLAPDLTIHSTSQALQCIQERMFDPIPEQRSGMNSVRIAEVLNYRRNLPKIISVAHVRALLNAPTKVEREIAELVQKGEVRRIIVPGRGVLGEAVVEWKEMEGLINNSSLSDEVKEAYKKALKERPNAVKIPRSTFDTETIRALMHAGFVTSATSSWTATDIYSSPGDGMRGTLISLDAIAKANSPYQTPQTDIHSAGGSGGRVKLATTNEDLNISLPNIGSYLKLLEKSRQRLISLLSRSKFKQAPESMLKERWNGGIPGEDASTERKIVRGEFAGVLPGRTTKWKSLFGVTFEWALEECVGSGLVEVFETGSVGRGVRVL